MSCMPTLEPGSMSLSYGDDVLDLDCQLGYVVTNFQIGWPEQRPVIRVRSLSDGIIDDTQFLGGRAVTVSLRLDHRKFPTQTLLDRLSRFMSPRIRPLLTWSLAGSPDEFRSLIVRGVDMPIVINGPKYQSVITQFLASEAFFRSSELTCDTLFPGAESQIGRTYDLTFDREYEYASPSGSKAFFNGGTAPTPWVGTIFGEITDPIVTINGVSIEFTGLTLSSFQRLVIDVESKTILLDGDPNESRYDFSNYTEWDWDDLLMKPGSNEFRMVGTAMSLASALTVCFYRRWLS